MSLLSGARNQKNNHLSEKIYNRMKQLFPSLSNSLASAAILVANTHGAVGEFDKALDVRNELKELNVKKQIGLSWTVINQHVYVSSNSD